MSTPITTPHTSKKWYQRGWVWIGILLLICVILGFAWPSSSGKDTDVVKKKKVVDTEEPADPAPKKKHHKKTTDDSNGTMHSGGIHVSQTVDIDGEQYSTSIPDENESVDEDDE
jgi:hypothetical protein